MKFGFWPLLPSRLVGIPCPGIGLRDGPPDLGVARATFKGSPPNQAPFISTKAFSRSCSSVNSTKPKHLDLPEIGSVMTRTVRIELGYDFWKNRSKWASVVEALKSPTKREYSGVSTIGADNVAPEAQLRRKYFFWLSGLSRKSCCEGMAMSGNNWPLRAKAL